MGIAFCKFALFSKLMHLIFFLAMTPILPTKNMHSFFRFVRSIYHKWIYER